ncbi:hypothetical protein ACNKHM_02495 [Shigella sonnei]
MSFFRSLGSSCNGKCRSTARQTRPSLGAGLFTDNHGMLITLRGVRAAVTGKREKDYLRRFPGVPDVGRTGRAACWTWFRARLLSRAASWLSYSEVGDDGKAGTAVGYGRLSGNPQK